MTTLLKFKPPAFGEHAAALDQESTDRVIAPRDEDVQRDQLNTVLISRSMQQALGVDNRVAMMRRARISHDFRAARDQRVHGYDALDRSNDGAAAIFHLLHV